MILLITKTLIQFNYIYLYQLFNFFWNISVKNVNEGILAKTKPSLLITAKCYQKNITFNIVYTSQKLFLTNKFLFDIFSENFKYKFL